MKRLVRNNLAPKAIDGTHRTVMGLVCESSKLFSNLDNIETVAERRDLGQTPVEITALNNAVRARTQSNGRWFNSQFDLVGTTGLPGT